MATRIYNEFDSDGANDLPSVHTLPVVRLLQPMIDGGGDTEFNFTDDHWEPSSPVGGHSGPSVTTAGASGTVAAAPEATEDNSMSLPIVQPAAASNTVASGADASCTIAATVAAGDSRAPRGRMALLEKALTDENEVRAGLLREEHAVRLQMTQEEHQHTLGELDRKKAFNEQMYRLQLQQQEKKTSLRNKCRHWSWRKNSSKLKFSKLRN
ncbi:hypothetical protein V5799_009090 [Amblyomma americanum]|uniref:Uncharacterized protein n=1 Tax=Amblyomma americanum TaxID=6943 RepID=A0AAQ4FBC0_AMBAM